MDYTEEEGQKINRDYNIFKVGEEEYKSAWKKGWESAERHGLSEPAKETKLFMETIKIDNATIKQEIKFLSNDWKEWKAIFKKDKENAPTKSDIELSITNSVDKVVREQNEKFLILNKEQNEKFSVMMRDCNECFARKDDLKKTQYWLNLIAGAIVLGFIAYLGNLIYNATIHLNK